MLLQLSSYISEQGIYLHYIKCKGMKKGGINEAKQLAKKTFEIRAKAHFKNSPKKFSDQELVSLYGYFVSTVGLDEEMIKRYVKYQEHEERKREKR